MIFSSSGIDVCEGQTVSFPWIIPYPEKQLEKGMAVIHEDVGSMWKKQPEEHNIIIEHPRLQVNPPNMTLSNVKVTDSGRYTLYIGTTTYSHQLSVYEGTY